MEYITPKMLYPQFLFALMHLAAKRKSGFQEVGGSQVEAHHGNTETLRSIQSHRHMKPGRH